MDSLESKLEFFFSWGLVVISWVVESKLVLGLDFRGGGFVWDGDYRVIVYNRIINSYLILLKIKLLLRYFNSFKFENYL